MVILEVFNKNLKVKYKSRLLTKTTFLVIFFKLCTILLPFLIAYYSRGFWLKRDEFYEQPNIKFRGEFIFVANDRNIGRNPIICSSFSRIKQYFEHLDNCTIIKIREFDYNYDGFIDKINFKVHINLPTLYRLSNLILIMPIDYKLRKECTLRMRSAIIYQTIIPDFVKDLLLFAKLRTVQTAPIRCEIAENYYDYSLIGYKKDLELFDIRNILKDYSTRNISTKLEDVQMSFINGNSKQFTFNLIVTIGENLIYYKPCFWQTLKKAWIEYLSIYAIIYYFINKILVYIFENRLVLFYEVHPFKTK